MQMNVLGLKNSFTLNAGLTPAMVSQQLPRPYLPTDEDRHFALTGLLTASLTPRFHETEAIYEMPGVKNAAYVSIEWLLGGNMYAALRNAGAEETVRAALNEAGIIMS